MPGTALSSMEQNRHLGSLYNPSWSLDDHLKLKSHWHQNATKLYLLSGWNSCKSLFVPQEGGIEGVEEGMGAFISI